MSGPQNDYLGDFISSNKSLRVLDLSGFSFILFLFFSSIFFSIFSPYFIKAVPKQLRTPQKLVILIIVSIYSKNLVCDFSFLSHFYINFCLIFCLDCKFSRKTGWGVAQGLKLNVTLQVLNLRGIVT